MRTASFVIAALTFVKAADELQAYVECTTTATAADQTAYDSVLEVEACADTVTADTCSAAALAVDTSASDGKLACVELIPGCNADDATHFQCVYYEQTAEVGAQGDDWDPRVCSEDETAAAGVVTWNSVDGSSWSADVADCPPEEEVEEEEEEEEESATGVSAGFATLAIAFALNM